MLLARKEWILARLKSAGLSLLWTLTGTKSVLGGAYPPDPAWPGRRIFWGALTLDRDDNLTGWIHHQYKAPNQHRAVETE